MSSLVGIRSQASVVKPTRRIIEEIVSHCENGGYFISDAFSPAVCPDHTLKFLLMKFRFVYINTSHGNIIKLYLFIS